MILWLKHSIVFRCVDHEVCSSVSVSVWESEWVAIAVRCHLSNTGWWRFEQMHTRYVVTAGEPDELNGIV